MNETQWASSDNPVEMLASAQGKVSDRKLRLFACACCLQVWDKLTDERSRRAVHVALRFADGLATEQETDAAWSDGWLAMQPASEEEHFARVCCSRDLPRAIATYPRGADQAAYFVTPSKAVAFTSRNQAITAVNDHALAAVTDHSITYSAPDQSVTGAN